jgi:hypothetical protein
MRELMAYCTPDIAVLLSATFALNSLVLYALWRQYLFGFIPVYLLWHKPDIALHFFRIELIVCKGPRSILYHRRELIIPALIKVNSCTVYGSVHVGIKTKIRLLYVHFIVKVRKICLK